MSEQNEASAPVARYRYTLTITGNTLDEIENELVAQVNGGFLLDSQHGQRDEWHVIGGRDTSRMEQPNPTMTPERYAAELGMWWRELKAR